ncbi:MAG: Rieske 2Fe-2S domain-containing protein [Proteobacteria bacterium]|nr:Rieske 2Fe-2S domain-containing protein [Pseudomonadota bacterium]
MSSLQLEPHKIPQPGQRTLVRRDGHSVVIFNVDGQLHAIEDECPHAGSALCTGRLDGHLIQCPAHGLRFDLRTGAMPGNAGMRIQVHAVQEKDGVHFLHWAGTGSAGPAQECP